MPSNLPREPVELGSEASGDVHRAVVSLIEELQAVDAYQQRVDATADRELRGVLRHNRDEEIEHAMMLLEWLRRTTPSFDVAIRTYLLSDRPITELETARADAPRGATTATDAGGDASLGVGSLAAARTQATRPITDSSRPEGS